MTTLFVKTSKNIAYQTILFLTAFIITIIPINSALGKSIKISFAGDIIMHNAVKKSAKENNIYDKKSKISINNNGFDHLFCKIKSAFNNSDIVFGNMEFPVSSPFESQKVIFNCSLEVLPALRKAGFTLVSIANNHTLDQKKRGLLNTIKYLNQYGLHYVGADRSKKDSRSGVIFNRFGIRIGFIAYTGIFNYPLPRRPRGYYVNDLYITKDVIKDIKAIRKRCDYLIMSIHTGEEFSIRPQWSDVRLIKKYIENGVDLVIGHHPHILQYVEKYTTADKRTCYIFYSLGNFISNHGVPVRLSRKNLSVNPRESVIVNLRLTKENNKLLTDFEIVPIMTKNVGRKTRRGKPYNDIQTVSIVEEMKELIGETITVKRSGKKRIEKKLIYLSSRINAIKSILFYKQAIKEIRYQAAPVR